MRGSPHIHMLLWIQDAPKLEDGNEEDVVKFIDQYVTCARGDDDLIGRQDHAHSRTCRKNGKNVCRFNFPQPPLSETMILGPLPEEMPEKDKVAHRKNWEKVVKALNDKKEAKSVTYEDFLKKIPLTEEDYILSIQSSIKRRTIFLQRAPDESRINNYNAPLLKSWRANMDIQYVLDAFSCAMYIVSYIAKSQRGMSNLLYNACKEAKRGNLDLKKQVYMIGNKFLNHVEVSAQEAVYYILQQQLYKASRDVVFVNTAPQDDRVVMLKSHRIIEGLPNESIDVEAAGIITHYSQRPECLDDMVLADYCAKYRRERSRGKSVVSSNGDDVEKNDDDDDDVEFNEDDVESNEDNVETNKDDVENKEDDAENIEHAVECVKDAGENTENSVKKKHDVDLKECYILKGGYRLVKRRKKAAHRYVHYHPEKDREHHFREILMLFRPWRVENNIIRGSSSYEEEFQKAEEEVCEKMKEYNHYSDALEKAMKDLKEMEEENLEEEWDKNAPNTQYAEKKDEEEGSKPSDTFPEFQPEEENQKGNDMSTELGGSYEESGPPDIIANMMPEEDYYQMIRSLNTKQREIFMYVLNNVKTQSTPFHIFITGGAGVGKSVVISAIHQAVLRFLNKGAGNPDEANVLLGARTGIAAFLIGGGTLHSLFHIPDIHGGE